MKFTVPVQAIIGPVVQVANICTSNPSNPDDLAQYMLMEVKKDALTLTGTDNTVQLQAVIPLAEGVESEGSCLITASRASEFFKTLGTEDDVTLELMDDEETLTILSDQAKYSLRVRLLPEDNAFPLFAIEEDGTPSSFVIEERKLRYMLDKSMFCVSHENYRDYLKGVRFEVDGDSFAIFALDGHRMAALDAHLPEPAEMPIAFSMTLRGVSELQKLLSTDPDLKLKLDVTDKFVSTHIGVYTISNRLLKCKYPNVRGVLPKNCSPELSVDLATLKTHVKRVALFSNKRLNHINLTFTENKLDLFSQNSEHEIGSAHIAIDYPDPEGHREINLNADYLKDFLNAIDTTEVVFGFAPPYQNTLIRPRDNGNDMDVTVKYVVSHIMV